MSSYSGWNYPEGAAPELDAPIVELWSAFPGDVLRLFYALEECSAAWESGQVC